MNFSSVGVAPTKSKFLKSSIESLPTTLEEALIELERDDLAKEILGEHLVEEFIRLKKQEIRSYRMHISQRELDNYLE